MRSRSALASPRVREGRLHLMTDAIPLVRCAGITKFYAGVQALDDVSLDLRAGECVCLVGDNGAGKSTLVKILSGILAPDGGEILIDERPVSLNRQEARRHGIEAVYQRPQAEKIERGTNRPDGQLPVILFAHV